MPKQAFALEPNGPKDLEISWKGIWKNITVTHDGEVLGTISNQKALKTGETFTLPDGSQLSVRLVQKFYAAELQIFRDGQPLPGTAADPETRYKGAYVVLFFIAGLNIILGLLAVVLQIEFLQYIGVGPYSIVFGLIFLALGFFTKMMSLVALIIGIVIFAIDAILGLVFSVSADVDLNISSLIMRLFLVIPMVQGVPAIRTLKQQVGEQ